MSFRPQEHRKECSDCGESIALNARRMKRRLLNKDANMPNVFIPGVAQAMCLLYGTDYYAIRPWTLWQPLCRVPPFFIQSGLDTVV